MFSCEFCEIYQNSLFTEHELLEISFNLKDFTDLFEIELFTSLISFSLRNIFSPSSLLKVGFAYARKLSWIFKSFSAESSPSQKIFEEVGFLRCIHLDQLRITGKLHPQIKLKCLRKVWIYIYLDNWYIKSSIYKRFLYSN